MIYKINDCVNSVIKINTFLHKTVNKLRIQFSLEAFESL